MSIFAKFDDVRSAFNALTDVGRNPFGIRFDEILSDDFLNTNPDGSLVDKRGFLEQIAPPVKIRDLACHDVNVRLMGDFAIVHACTTYTLPDGRPGKGRYTDIYARRDGRWLCVAAQVARS